MLRARVVLGVEPNVADHVVDPAVAVEIRRGDRRPPAGAGGGKAGPLGPVLETPALVVMEILHWAPLQCDQQIGPAVAVDITPEGGRHHADLAQTRRDPVGDVFEAAAPVGE